MAGRRRRRSSCARGLFSFARPSRAAPFEGERFFAAPAFGWRPAAPPPTPRESAGVATAQLDAILAGQRNPVSRRAKYTLIGLRKHVEGARAAQMRATVATFLPSQVGQRLGLLSNWHPSTYSPARSPARRPMPLGQTNAPIVVVIISPQQAVSAQRNRIALFSSPTIAHNGRQQK